MFGAQQRCQGLIDRLGWMPLEIPAHVDARQSARFWQWLCPPARPETGPGFEAVAIPAPVRQGTGVLDSQTLAAFGAACGDHSAAATGFHAGEKTVRACALDFGWLVRAFHGQSW